MQPATCRKKDMVNNNHNTYTSAVNAVVTATAVAVAARAGTAVLAAATAGNGRRKEEGTTQKNEYNAMSPSIDLHTIALASHVFSLSFFFLIAVLEAVG